MLGQILDKPLREGEASGLFRDISVPPGRRDNTSVPGMWENVGKPLKIY